MWLRQVVAVRRRRIAIMQFSTPKPSFGHPNPHRFALRGVCYFSHDPAFSCKFHELL
jgi:hypothetical protein